MRALSPVCGRRALTDGTERRERMSDFPPCPPLGAAAFVVGQGRFESHRRPSSILRSTTIRRWDRNVSHPRLKNGQCSRTSLRNVGVSLDSKQLCRTGMCGRDTLSSRRWRPSQLAVNVFHARRTGIRRQADDFDRHPLSSLSPSSFAASHRVLAVLYEQECKTKLVQLRCPHCEQAIRLDT